MIIKRKKLWYLISGALVAVSLFSFIAWGLKPAIDFTGGSLLEVEYNESRPDIGVLKETVVGLELGNVLVQPLGDRGVLIRARELAESERALLINSLNRLGGGGLVEKRFNSIGPVIGKELARNSWISIGLVLLMIIIFIAWSFRKVSKPVASWKYGLAAIMALAHDVIIPVGVFSFLGHFYNVEVDTLFVTALLTILGFSIHDTIVVFDRIRENLKRGGSKFFEDIVEQSVWQVMGRSIKTSFAILLVLAALLLFGGQTTFYFTLTLILGIFFGTYSSIFLASPLLVSWQMSRERKK